MFFDFLEIFFTAGFWAATIRIACPLIFATLGEVICERSGVLNLGIEGIMSFLPGVSRIKSQMDQAGVDEKIITQNL